MMFVKTMAITNVKCVKCGHDWIPRSEKKPKQCPSCGSASWDGISDEGDAPPTFQEVRRWLPAELLIRVDKIARESGLSFGELVILSLEEELKRRKSKPAKTAV